MIPAIFQAAGNVVQAATDVIDTGRSIVEAETTLRNRDLDMKEKMNKLVSIKGNVDLQLTRYWFPRDRIDSWSSDVKRIEEKVNELKTKMSCGVNWNPDDFIQKIENICKDIADAISDGKKLQEDLRKTRIKSVIQSATLIKIANISALQKNMDLLIEYVKDDSVNSIKVYGEPGTGKRVLIQHLNNHEALAKIFHVVIWISASELEYRPKNRTIEEHIQLIIAQRLELRVEHIENKNVIASVIRDELVDAKYLLLMEDIKEKIEVETLGIPMNTKGSKIVYTTNLHLPPIGEFRVIPTGKLGEDDSFELFDNIITSAGNKIEKGVITRIARQVVKWCDGNFSLIKEVAQNFKSKKSPETWRHSWNILRTPAEKGATYMKVWKDFLHFSYDGLKENQKNCFLFSLLYPNEHKIPVACLFDCWVANDLLGSDLIGEVVLEHLVEMALFSKGPNERYVTINKICRGAAMTILQKHDKFKTLVAEEVPQSLYNFNWEDMHWISLADSGIESLPIKVHCPKLTSLFLQQNSNLKNISRLFFDHMGELIVLDLYNTKFDSVLYLEKLGKLKVLYVNGCSMLNKIPFEIGVNDSLEVLDMRGCIINEIPDNIKMLNHLRRLMVSIQKGGSLRNLMICKLSSLKELIIDVELKDEDDMTCYNEVIKDVLEKIDTLDKLTALKFYFKDHIVDVIQVMDGILKIFLPNEVSLNEVLKEKIKNTTSPLQIYIGLRMTSYNEFPESYNCDKFVLSCDKTVIDPIILTKVNALVVMEHNSMEHLDQIEILSTSLPYIHECLVLKCNNIETLMLSVCFLNLTTLVISECSTLKNLFSNNVVQQFSQFKYLEIRDCHAIEKINMLSTGGVDILPNLTTLVLHDLPKLTKICSDLEKPTLTTLKIHKCPMLTELPLNGKQFKEPA